MALVRLEMLVGMVLEMKMVMISQMPSESKLIGHLHFKEIHNV
jgi:hypothetical protein